MAPPSSASCPRAPRRARRAAFTLVEMLVVLGVTSILLTLTLPAVTHLLGAGNLSTAAFAVSDTLEKARAYAMANSTYVWVGFAEQNAASNTVPAPAGVGTVTITAAASRDGTCVYNTASPTALDPSRLIFLDRAQRFDGVHLDTAQDAQTYDATLTPASSMYRTAVDQAADEIGDPTCVSLTPFTAPANGTSMTFSKVVEFSPQGVVRVVAGSGTNPRAVPNLAEILLQPTHGTTIDKNGNIAAVQVDGLTGATRVYRP